MFTAKAAPVAFLLLKPITDHREQANKSFPLRNLLCHKAYRDIKTAIPAKIADQSGTYKISGGFIIVNGITTLRLTRLLAGRCRD
jgi:hypothetical protein